MLRNKSLIKLLSELKEDDYALFNQYCDDKIPEILRSHTGYNELLDILINLQNNIDNSTTKIQRTQRLWQAYYFCRHILKHANDNIIITYENLFKRIIEIYCNLGSCKAITKNKKESVILCYELLDAYNTQLQLSQNKNKEHLKNTFQYLYDQVSQVLRSSLEYSYEIPMYVEENYEELHEKREKLIDYFRKILSENNKLLSDQKRVNTDLTRFTFMFMIEYINYAKHYNNNTEKVYQFRKQINQQYALIGSYCAYNPNLYTKNCGYFIDNNKIFLVFANVNNFLSLTPEQRKIETHQLDKEIEKLRTHLAHTVIDKQKKDAVEEAYPNFRLLRYLWVLVKLSETINPNSVASFTSKVILCALDSLKLKNYAALNIVKSILEKQVVKEYADNNEKLSVVYHFIFKAAPLLNKTTDFETLFKLAQNFQKITDNNDYKDYKIAQFNLIELAFNSLFGYFLSDNEFKCEFIEKQKKVSAYIFKSLLKYLNEDTEEILFKEAIDHIYNLMLILTTNTMRYLSNSCSVFSYNTVQNEDINIINHLKAIYYFSDRALKNICQKESLAEHIKMRITYLFPKDKFHTTNEYYVPMENLKTNIAFVRKIATVEKKFKLDPKDYEIFKDTNVTLVRPVVKILPITMQRPVKKTLPKIATIEKESKQAVKKSTPKASGFKASLKEKLKRNKHKRTPKKNTMLPVTISTAREDINVSQMTDMEIQSFHSSNSLKRTGQKITLKKPLRGLRSRKITETKKFPLPKKDRLKLTSNAVSSKKHEQIIASSQNNSNAGVLISNHGRFDYATHGKLLEDNVTVGITLKEYIKNGFLEQAELLYNRTLPLANDKFLLINAMIEGYGNNGYLNKAKSYFKQAENQKSIEVSTFNAMIIVCGNNRDIKSSEFYYHKALSLGIANMITERAIIIAYTVNNREQDTESILKRAIKNYGEERFTEHLEGQIKNNFERAEHISNTKIGRRIIENNNTSKKFSFFNFSIQFKKSPPPVTQPILDTINNKLSKHQRFQCLKQQVNLTTEWSHITTLNDFLTTEVKNKPGMTTALFGRMVREYVINPHTFSTSHCQIHMLCGGSDTTLLEYGRVHYENGYKYTFKAIPENKVIRVKVYKENKSCQDDYHYMTDINLHFNKDWSNHFSACIDKSESSLIYLDSKQGIGHILTNRYGVKPANVSRNSLKREESQLKFRN